MKKANYIIALVKSVGKDLQYALSIVVWYSNTEKEDSEISEYIIKNW